MNKVFEVKDKSGRLIYLSEERWKHIITEHPELSQSLEDIKDTITKPLTIRNSKYDEEVVYYYRQYKEISRYLFVAVKYLNGSGFIITSFYIRRLK